MFIHAKKLFFGVIITPATLQYGPFVIHDTAPVKEIPDAVFCVEIQVLCAKPVFILVYEFNHPSPDFCCIEISQVMDCFTGKPGPFLDDLDIANGMDHVLLGIPDGRVAKNVCVVMKKTGRTCHFPVTDPE
jgi:hypothetical protein